jgi:intraflagellar transport protein 172
VPFLTGQSMAIESALGQPITKIDIYQNRFVVASTAKSLLLGDLTSNRLGEILWGISGTERFFLGNPQVKQHFACSSY